MSRLAPHSVLKRRRVKLTNYARRFRLLKSGLPRLVLRKSNHYVLAQLVEYSPEGDRVVWTRTTRELVLAGEFTSGTCSGACTALGAVLPVDSDLQFVIDIGMRRPLKTKPFFVASVVDGFKHKLSDRQYKRVWNCNVE
jgi:large subunit ribosomal protein L18